MLLIKVENTVLCGTRHFLIVARGDIFAFLCGPRALFFHQNVAHIYVWVWDPCLKGFLQPSFLNSSLVQRSFFFFFV